MISLAEREKKELLKVNYHHTPTIILVNIFTAHMVHISGKEGRKEEEKGKEFYECF